MLASFSALETMNSRSISLTKDLVLWFSCWLFSSTAVNGLKPGAMSAVTAPPVSSSAGLVPLAVWSSKEGAESEHEGLTCPSLSLRLLHVVSVVLTRHLCFVSAVYPSSVCKYCVYAVCSLTGAKTQHPSLPTPGWLMFLRKRKKLCK